MSEHDEGLEERIRKLEDKCIRYEEELAAYRPIKPYVAQIELTQKYEAARVLLSSRYTAVSKHWMTMVIAFTTATTGMIVLITQWGHFWAWLKRTF